MALLQAVYAAQAFLSPEAFAAARGTPLAADGDPAWVLTYASRTIFVSLTVALLLARGAMSTLRWVALVALVMPAGDLFVALEAGAPRSILLRHIGTIAYLGFTFAIITRWLRRNRLGPAAWRSGPHGIASPSARNEGGEGGSGGRPSGGPPAR